MSPKIPPASLWRSEPVALALDLHVIGMWPTARQVGRLEHVVLPVP